jgi:hypothetical protein
MDDSDLKEMISLLKRINYLSKKYSKMYKVETEEDEPIYIPEEVYDEICRVMKSKEILFVGVC